MFQKVEAFEEKEEEEDDDDDDDDDNDDDHNNGRTVGGNIMLEPFESAFSRGVAFQLSILFTFVSESRSF